MPKTRAYFSVKIIVLICGFILVSIGCATDISFDIDKLKQCVKTDDKCLIVVSVATKNILPSSYQYYTDSLVRFGYDYHIIGDTLGWKGWISRGKAMKSAMSFLKNNFSDDEVHNKIIVVTSDTGDVLVQKSATDLLDKYQKKLAEIKQRFDGQLTTDALVIVGGEWWCETNCEKRSSVWFDRLNIDKTERYFPYPQGGFLIGPAASLYDYYDYTVNFMSREVNDDQIAMGRFAMEHPEKIYIDYRQELAATAILGGKFNPTTDLNYEATQLYQLAPQGIALGVDLQQKMGSADLIYPAFIHVPNNTRSQTTKVFWDSYVEHLKNTAWK